MQKLDLKKLNEIDIKGIWTIDLNNFKEGYEIKGVISHSKIYSKGTFLVIIFLQKDFLVLLNY